MQIFDDLLGHEMTSVVIRNGDELIFTRKDGVKFRFYHSQECCEHVRIDDIEGDLGDLVGAPITMAEEISSDRSKIYNHFCRMDDGSYTWTFYKFATIKGRSDYKLETGL